MEPWRRVVALERSAFARINALPTPFGDSGWRRPAQVDAGAVQRGGDFDGRRCRPTTSPSRRR